ncbi:MAG: sensor histidine kinase, partial [bacterium]
MFSNKFFNNALVQHTLFWLLCLGFLIFQRYSIFDSDIDLDDFIKVSTKLFGYSIAVYLNLRLFIPHFFQKKRYSLFFITLAGSLLFSGFLIDMMYVYGLRTLIPLRHRFEGLSFAPIFIFSVQTFVFVVITTLIHFTKDWIQFQDVSLKFKEVEKQKLDAELKALKAQINPHFLFNSLNNIYSLSLDKSDKSPELILKLSELMRYILYECKDDYVPLEKELGFINNYLDLEKIRTDEKVDIRFETLGAVNSQRIAPLLFMPFIENAFKHGVNVKQDDAFINMTVNTEEAERLVFKIENNLDDWRDLENG